VLSLSLSLSLSLWFMQIDPASKASLRHAARPTKPAGPQLTARPNVESASSGNGRAYRTIERIGFFYSTLFREHVYSCLCTSVYKLSVSECDCLCVGVCDFVVALHIACELDSIATRMFLQTVGPS
jgi:hypothetical protein